MKSLKKVNLKGPKSREPSRKSGFESIFRAGERLPPPFLTGSCVFNSNEAISFAKFVCAM